MFDKVLIANRGEIALRIERACRELGLQTVAVYAEPDRQALHVRLADEAYPLGGASARDSYLRGDHLIDIARRSGAGAIHPGYGFLAERADFAAACHDAGLVFVGPKPSAIAAMGDKEVARRTVAAAGVPVVPGTEGEGALRDADLLALAPGIGFPLLIKASAGGGGKGMRAVESLAEMPALLQAARREAEAAFGDGNVYLEKLVEGARHIEIQILADQRGQVIHLGERECSLQRHHQKLVEEAPSPFVDAALRAEMGAVAVRAAQTVAYASAGTIEFLVDAERRFYFLEMNTRLQVEHPITELVTGVDIVQAQLRIAQGEPLGVTQAEIAPRGWAIECRLNAEDALDGFLPSSGRITHLTLPGGPGVRVDGGVYAGLEVTTHYDALLAKLIVWADSRPQAVARMQRALAECRIAGVRTNLPFHRRLLADPRFAAGAFDTRFIEREFAPAGVLPTTVGVDEAQAAAILATLAAHQAAEQAAVGASDCAEPRGRWKWSLRPGGRS